MSFHATTYVLSPCAEEDIQPLGNQGPPLRKKRLVRLDLKQRARRGNALRSEGCCPIFEISGGK